MNRPVLYSQRKPRDVDAAVLAGKIAPPRAGGPEVERADICQRIATTRAKLTLVHAPAGFGKTTAMVQARARLDQDNVQTAWITLDRSDNDVPRLISCFLAASAQAGVDALPVPTLLEILRELSNAVAAFTLFIDNFEKLVEPAALGLVRELIEHLPRNCQLVIGTRGWPDLNVGRLRVQGQLLEIDAESLRFSTLETQQLISLRLKRSPAPDSVARLQDKTEGWAAALCLAVAALERHGVDSDFIDRFSGSSREVAAYLAEDVLLQQSAEIRDFLLRTSILRQLNPSVCAALNPWVDTERILDQLSATNLFLIPVDGEDRTWRYHGLFAGFLKAQLSRTKPDDVARLHLAASGWYEAEGRAVPAIDHAIEGGDTPYALSLLEQHVDQFLNQGRMRLLARWFVALRSNALVGHPLLQAMAVWATTYTQGPWKAMELLDSISSGERTDPAVRSHINAQKPVLLAMMDRYEESYLLGLECLEQLPTLSPFADGVLCNTMGYVVSVLGHHGEAHRLLDDARRTEDAGVFIRMYTESMEGLLDLQFGRMRQAAARFRIAVGSTRTFSNHLTSGNAWAGILHASAVYEGGDIEQAEHLLNVYLPLARDVGLPDHMIIGYRIRSRIAFQHGDVDQSLRLISELENLGADRHLPRVVASAKLERARLLLQQGHADASLEELKRADDVSLWKRFAHLSLVGNDADDIVIGRSRWDIAFGDPRVALRRLEQNINEAVQASRHGRAVKLRLLAAAGSHRSGDLTGSVKDFLLVLRQSYDEGYFRLIVDEGPTLRPLLHLAMSLGHRVVELKSDPVLLEYLQRLVEAIGPPVFVEAQPGYGDSNLPPMDPLTRKEIRVLQLLAEGYSNGAMAEKLFVSDSTVRTHLRNINSKLNANSRTQAIAIARKLGVLN